MPWLEVSVRVARQHADLVETLLQNQPVLAVTMTDDADDPVLEPGVGETPLWPSVCVTALFDGDTDTAPIAQMLSLIPGVDRPQLVNFRRFDDQQWERVWLDRFQPMRFGKDLWIVPGDQTVPEGAGVVLRLDPGLAFGTGTHPTTRLCLQWIDSHDFAGKTILDFGCGSGVLGIVAAIKGARRVVCVDNDPQALTATHENAVRNAVGDVIEALSPEEFANRYPRSSALGQAHFDVVLANILAGPLIELAPLLLDQLREGGEVVLSGVLTAQSNEVAAAYQSQTDKIDEVIDEGWVRLHGCKRQYNPVNADSQK
jgi:ribosomal protein L11 methyltransferase